MNKLEYVSAIQQAAEDREEAEAEAARQLGPAETAWRGAERGGREAGQ
jgi:hypothetical protein